MANWDRDVVMGTKFDFEETVSYIDRHNLRFDRLLVGSSFLFETLTIAWNREIFAAKCLLRCQNSE
jgi:hypothetical protein